MHAQKRIPEIRHGIDVSSHLDFRLRPQPVKLPAKRQNTVVLSDFECPCDLVCKEPGAVDKVAVRYPTLGCLRNILSLKTMPGTAQVHNDTFPAGILYKHLHYTLGVDDSSILYIQRLFDSLGTGLNHLERLAINQL